MWVILKYSVIFCKGVEQSQEALVLVMRSLMDIRGQVYNGKFLRNDS